MVENGEGGGGVGGALARGGGVGVVRWRAPRRSAPAQPSALLELHAEARLRLALGLELDTHKVVRPATKVWRFFAVLRGPAAGFRAPTENSPLAIIVYTYRG